MPFFHRAYLKGRRISRAGHRRVRSLSLSLVIIDNAGQSRGSAKRIVIFSLFPPARPPIMEPREIESPEESHVARR